MDDRDLELRRLTYQLFVDRGRAPTPDEVASVIETTEADVEAGWRRLHDAHALVLNPATNEIRMVNPFSAVPTAYRVHARGRWWYANCAWDACGVCAALHTDGRIETSCPDCGEPLAVEVRDQRPSDQGCSSLPRCGRALVGRHRLHLKHHESPPVGGAHRALAGQSRPRRDDRRHHAQPARTHLVERPRGAGMATTYGP